MAACPCFGNIRGAAASFPICPVEVVLGPAVLGHPLGRIHRVYEMEARRRLCPFAIWPKLGGTYSIAWPVQNQSQGFGVRKDRFEYRIALPWPGVG